MSSGFNAQKPIALGPTSRNCRAAHNTSEMLDDGNANLQGDRSNETYVQRLGKRRILASPQGNCGQFIRRS